MNKLQLLRSDPESKTIREPALAVGTTASAALAVLEAINAIFPHLLNDTAQTILYYALLVLIPVVTAWLIRNKVWAPASVVEVVNQATKEARERADELQLKLETQRNLTTELYKEVPDQKD